MIKKYPRVSVLAPIFNSFIYALEKGNASAVVESVTSPLRVPYLELTNYYSEIIKRLAARKQIKINGISFSLIKNFKNE